MPAFAKSPVSSTPMVESNAPSGAGMSPAISSILRAPATCVSLRAISATSARSLMRRAGTCGTALKPASPTAFAATVRSSQVWLGNSAMKMSVPFGTSVAASARSPVSLQVISIEAFWRSARICSLLALMTDMIERNSLELLLLAEGQRAEQQQRRNRQRTPAATAIDRLGFGRPDDDSRVGGARNTRTVGAGDDVIINARGRGRHRLRARRGNGGFGPRAARQT